METTAYPSNERKRHPGDVVRLVLGIVFFLLTSALAFGGHVSQTEEYLFRLINSLPGLLYPLIHFIMQAGSFAFVGVAAVVAVGARRYRLALKIALGGTTAWLLTRVAKVLAQRDRPAYLFEGIIDRAHATGILGFPSGHAAVAAVLATVVSPYVSKNWRRFIWIIAWIVAVARVYGGAHLPLDVFAGLSLGWAVGSAVNLLFGTPVRPVPIGAIRQKLQLAHLGVANVEIAQTDARGSTPLVITTGKRRKFFGKLIDNENRNADLLYKLWRYLIIKEREGEAPFASARQLAEHEAYLYAQAASAGARVPRVELAAPVTDAAALLLTEKISGVTLDTYTKPLTERLLTNVWRQAQAIHAIGLAHRDLRAANIIVDKKGAPWLIDFTFSELASGPQPLAMDRVELLVSLSLKTDPKAVVQAATRVLGSQTVGETLAYLQPASLSTSTRGQLKKRKDLLAEIRHEVAQQSGQRETTPVRVYRFSNQTLIWVGLLVLLTFIVATKFRHVEAYLEALKNIGLWWMAAAIGVSALTYVASATVVLGSTFFRLSYLKVVILQFATTFVNRFTPLNIGQAVIIQRFLENSGLERAKAVASTSIVYLASFVVHIVLLFVVAVVFVRYPIHVHSPKSWAIVLAIILALSALVLLTLPKIRPLVRKYVSIALLTARQTFGHPIKALQLFGGALAISIFYSLALYFSLHGFGVELAFDKVLLVYLAGSAIASAAPIPGGLGVTEVALVAGLVTFGVPEAAAILGVLAYRIFTYLLPTLPGVFAFRYLQKRNLLDI